MRMFIVIGWIIPMISVAVYSIMRSRDEVDSKLWVKKFLKLFEKLLILFLKMLDRRKCLHVDTQSTRHHHLVVLAGVSRKHC